MLASALAPSGLLFALLQGRPALSDMAFISASEPLLEWTGRRIPASGGQGWSIDWEGTRMRATVCNATSVSAAITDTTAGATPLSGRIDPSDPMPSSLNVPDLRVSTFFTTEGTNLSYALSSRAAIKQACVTYTLQLLIEPAFILDDGPSRVLTIEGLRTDGRLVTTPEPATRRTMEILGDSLTAGYGAERHVQRRGGLTDDQGVSYGALLCANFSARCTTEAVSGITLYTGRGFNLPLTWDWELGGMLQNRWPKASMVPYNASRFLPDAVLINLGENDWGGGKCGTTPGCPGNFTRAYVAYVLHISEVYAKAGKQGDVTFFLTIGPHEHGQSSAILPAVQQLKSNGVRALFLNATVPDYGTIGCGGHPGVTIHHASFMRAQPVIAAAMGW
eukprot:gene3960-4320_t